MSLRLPCCLQDLPHCQHDWHVTACLCRNEAGPELRFAVAMPSKALLAPASRLSAELWSWRGHGDALTKTSQSPDTMCSQISNVLVTAEAIETQISQQVIHFGVYWNLFNVLFHPYDAYLYSIPYGFACATMGPHAAPCDGIKTSKLQVRGVASSMESRMLLRLCKKWGKS